MITMPVTRINRSALLPYTQEAVFALVADIESYPHYMEGCLAATILSADATVVEATLQLGKGKIRQQFTTRNAIQKPQRINMTLVEGPFRSFQGQWDFLALTADASKVSLDLQFELDNQLASLAAGKLFESVASSLVDSLCRRARGLYGDPAFTP